MATIESILRENRIFPPADEFVSHANIAGMKTYEALRQEAARDYTGFGQSSQNSTSPGTNPLPAFSTIPIRHFTNGSMMVN